MKNLLMENIEINAFKITSGIWNERAKTGTEISIRKDSLVEAINKTFDETLPTVPVKVGLYLSKDINRTLHEKVKFLLEAQGGDRYYFCEMMPEDGDLTQDHGEWLYEWAMEQDLEFLFSIINGYKIEGVKDEAI